MEFICSVGPFAFISLLLWYHKRTKQPGLSNWIVWSPMLLWLAMCVISAMILIWFIYAFRGGFW